MTRTTESVTYRQEQPTPTEPGLYYAIDRDDGDAQMTIVEVFGCPLVVATFGLKIGEPLADFRFFGPVTPCKEG